MPTAITGSIVHVWEQSSGTQFAVSSSVRDTAIGIVLPIGNANNGSFFKQSYTTIDAAKSNIKNLILTMRGERIMHPTLGTGLWNLVFEPMQSGDTLEAVKATITDNVEFWLPYINLDDVDVTFNDGNNSIQIKIDWRESGRANRSGYV